MTRVTKFLTQSAIAAIIGMSAVAATATAASAYVVCNRYGDCWQTSQRYHFPIHLGVRYQDGSDNYWHRHHQGHRWHDDNNRDNGYWDRDRSWHNY